MTDGLKKEPVRGEETAVIERQQTEKPRRYLVILHNDDYTSQEFVVEILVKFFHKDETAATQIMLQVHHKGHGAVGHFTRDVAETKVQQVISYAKKNGYPLKCTAEPEGSGF